MKKIISFIKDLPRQWKAETPKIAKWIRNIAALLTTSIPTAYGIVKVMGVFIPEWFDIVVLVSTFICALITGVAGTKEVK